MREGSLFAVRVAEAIVVEARTAVHGTPSVAVSPRAVVRMARATEPPPLYIPARRPRYGLFVALGLIAVSLGYGIFGR